MVKILKGISKSTLESQYIFDKKEVLVEILYNFFRELGIDDDNFDLEHLLVTEEYDRDKSGERFVSIFRVEDFRYTIKNEVYDIDIFFGTKKVILVIRTKKDLQQEIAEKLFKFADFEEVKNGD